MNPEVVAPKKPLSLSQVTADVEKMVSAAEQQAGGVDPLSIAVPRGGEHFDPNAEDGLTGNSGASADPLEQPGVAPIIDSQPEPASSEPPVTGAQIQPQVDPWAEFDEIEYEDSDTGEKFPVRAQKSYAQKVKDGYARRSVMDRNARYLAGAKQTLEPLITSGEFYKIQPMLDMALHDPTLASAMGELYARHITGQPITFSDAVAQASPQQRQEAQQHVAAGTDLDSIQDPLVRQVVEGLDNRMAARLAPYQEELNRTRGLAEAQEQARRNEAFARNQAARTYNEALTELRTVYPTDFNGAETDHQKISALWQYANSAGYIGQPGPQGYDPMQIRLGLRLAYRERMATSIPSPAVQALSAAQVEQNARAQAANQVAGRTGGGNVTPIKPATTANERMKAVTTRRKDGAMKSPKELVEQTLRAIEG